MASKAGLIGAKSRDAWKYWHKTQCPPWGSRFWGLDVDFVLVDKNPPRIIAVLDYKQPHDIVGFSEVIAYNAFIDAGMGVFIIGIRTAGIRNSRRFRSRNIWAVITVLTRP